MIYFIGFGILSLVFWITIVYNAWLEYLIIGFAVSSIIATLDCENFLKFSKMMGNTTDTYLFIFLMDIILWPSSIFFFTNRVVTKRDI